jgi:hypothetical protein
VIPSHCVCLCVCARACVRACVCMGHESQCVPSSSNILNTANQRLEVTPRIPYNDGKTDGIRNVCFLLSIDAADRSSTGILKLFSWRTTVCDLTHSVYCK